MALSYCKKLSALFRGITSNNNAYFYCIILKNIKMYVKVIIIAM